MVDLSQLEKVKTAADIELESNRVAALRYLSETDWYVVRSFETQVAVPDEVSAGRLKARRQINDAQVALV